uniref:Uncharacterized protein n=1 Tax=Leersia perrieri TaxID=77586 RepID=A0A0D9XDC4_9ORYZ
MRPPPLPDVVPDPIKTPPWNRRAPCRTSPRLTSLSANHHTTVGSKAVVTGMPESVRMLFGHSISIGAAVGACRHPGKHMRCHSRIQNKKA